MCEHHYSEYNAIRRICTRSLGDMTQGVFKGLQKPAHMPNQESTWHVEAYD